MMDQNCIHKIWTIWHVRPWILNNFPWKFQKWMTFYHSFINRRNWPNSEFRQNIDTEQELLICGKLTKNVNSYQTHGKSRFIRRIVCTFQQYGRWMETQIGAWWKCDVITQLNGNIWDHFRFEGKSSVTKKKEKKRIYFQFLGINY